MKPLRDRLAQAARSAGVALPVVEKDYALGYVLAGIAAVPALSESLVFKGGTALKKAYFGDYRFSEDLDFSAVGGPVGEAMDESVAAAIHAAAGLLDAWGPFRVEAERYVERDPHPAGQDAFLVRVAFPWQREALCRVKLEITHDEPVLLEPDRRSLLHGYGEDLQASILCYRLEEIIAEKLRALLQTQERLARRGWNRPRARDYYDLWRLFDRFGHEVDRDALPELLDRKCAVRGVSWATLDDFFTEALQAEARRHWRGNLGPFVRDLPPCDDLLSQVRSALADLPRIGL